MKHIPYVPYFGLLTIYVPDFAPCTIVFRIPGNIGLATKMTVERQANVSYGQDITCQEPIFDRKP